MKAYLYLTLLLIWSITSCDNNTDDNGYTITISAFELNNGVYTNTGNSIILNSTDACQTWSRTSLDTIHGNNGAHLHYNAAKEVNYDAQNTSISYTEYGPELSQEDIDAVCSTNASGGVSKTVNSSAYYQDKPNVYLKITNVE